MTRQFDWHLRRKLAERGLYHRLYQLQFGHTGEAGA